MVEDLDQRLFLEFPLISFIKFSLDINYLSHLIFSCVDKAEKCCSIARSFRCHTNSSTPYQVWWRWDFPFVYMPMPIQADFMNPLFVFLQLAFWNVSQGKTSTLLYIISSLSLGQGAIGRFVVCDYAIYFSQT